MFSFSSVSFCYNFHIGFEKYVASCVFKNMAEASCKLLVTSATDMREIDEVFSQNILASDYLAKHLLVSFTLGCFSREYQNKQLPCYLHIVYTD